MHDHLGSLTFEVNCPSILQYFPEKSGLLRFGFYIMYTGKEYKTCFLKRKTFDICKVVSRSMKK